MLNNVCVFASASDIIDEVYYKDAREIGLLLGKYGFNIVYGGSRLGLMYSCASAVKESGGKIIGVMPKKLSDLGYSNPKDCDEFYLTDGMRGRKAKMDEISTAAIALAGGFGTLEEISEMIVQKQLGYNNKPIVFLNTNGFYNDLIRFFDNVIKYKFAKEGSEKLYYIANTPEDAIKYICSYKTSNREVSSKF